MFLRHQNQRILRLTRIIPEELKACGLNLALVCGFGSDGASVMTGKNNGVGARLQKVCSIFFQSQKTQPSRSMLWMKYKCCASSSSLKKITHLHSGTTSST